MEIFLDEQKAAEDNQRERQRGSREEMTPEEPGEAFPGAAEGERDATQSAASLGSGAISMSRP
jgi:hypothetical protein